MYSIFAICECHRSLRRYINNCGEKGHYDGSDMWSDQVASVKDRTRQSTKKKKKRKAKEKKGIYLFIINPVGSMIHPKRKDKYSFDTNNVTSVFLLTQSHR